MSNPSESSLPSEAPGRDEPLLEPGSLLAQVRDYWNAHIHDLEMTRHAPGTREFFQDLDAYRFDKLRYLPRLVDFAGYRDRRLLEVGCGIGIDLARFARGGAQVTGVDLSRTAIGLARRHLELAGLSARLQVANGEQLPFEAESFDLVYAHGVLQYTADPAAMARECRRVLVPGGAAIFMVYNRYSWLTAMSKLTRVELEHQDAPVLRTFSSGELRRLLAPFREIRIVPERFPVASRLHRGWKAALYNQMFVPAFDLLPRAVVRPLGWHLMAFCRC
ncbi:MAG TPA: class I SAM-dependent methyltransferase [Acidobacteriota bacterium]